MTIALLHTEAERAASPPLSPKDRLGWLNARGHVTDSQKAAGDLLMKDRERKERVAYACSSSSHGNRDLNPLEAAQTARRRYERALTAITPMGEAVIQAVLIDGMSNEEAGQALGLHIRAITPMLKLALEILAQHYQVP
jgi:DNA-directed RNA polymerase specialized sigma24 family protein